jgi:secondary thiamine-phosphate synthase enzyme
MVTLEVTTTRSVEVVDITDRVIEAVAKSSVREGLCTIHVPHTTAGVIVNENDDPDVMRDLLAHFASLVPKSPQFRHAEGNADAHIKSVVTGCTTVLIVSDGRPVLGRWQGVFFCEFDGPRRRRAHVSVLGGA